MLLAEAGIDVKYHHHEVGGSGQLEIEVELGDVVKMADHTMNIKYIIKNQAILEGKTATFCLSPYMARREADVLHMLLKKDNKPIFYDLNGYAQLSETAHYFIGGLLKHAASICASQTPQLTLSSALSQVLKRLLLLAMQLLTEVLLYAFLHTQNHLI